MFAVDAFSGPRSSESGTTSEVTNFQALAEHYGRWTQSSPAGRRRPADVLTLAPARARRLELDEKYAATDDLEHHRWLHPHAGHGGAPDAADGGQGSPSADWLSMAAVTIGTLAVAPAAFWSAAGTRS